jgi:hypothetical protein
MKEGARGGMFSGPLKFEDINSLINRFTTIILSFIASNAVIWLPIILAEANLKELETAVLSVFSDN